MIEFLKRFFGQSGSSATAKDRLRLVLMTDHLELSPDMIETMKRELVDVISRHVEVDRDRIEVNFERQDRTLAMLANIPIVSVNRPTANGSAHTAVQPATTAAPVAEPESEKQPPAKAPKVRKRRRRKKSATPALSPSP